MRMRRKGRRFNNEQCRPRPHTRKFLPDGCEKAGSLVKEQDDGHHREDREEGLLKGARVGTQASCFLMGATNPTQKLHRLLLLLMPLLSSFPKSHRSAAQASKREDNVPKGPTSPLRSNRPNCPSCHRSIIITTASE